MQETNFKFLITYKWMEGGGGAKGKKKKRGNIGVT